MAHDNNSGTADDHLYRTERRRTTRLSPNSYVIFLFFLLNFAFILDVQSKPGVQRTSHNIGSGTLWNVAADAALQLDGEERADHVERIGVRIGERTECRACGREVGLLVSVKARRGAAAVIEGIAARIERGRG